MENKNNFLPPVNQRIKELIDSRFNGSVRQFSMAMGIEQYQKINRLFSPDKRSGKYPKPSIDIISEISNTFDISIAWLQNGDVDMLKKGEAERPSESKSIPTESLQPPKVI